MTSKKVCNLLCHLTNLIREQGNRMRLVVIWLLGNSWLTSFWGHWAVDAFYEQQTNHLARYGTMEAVWTICIWTYWILNFVPFGWECDPVCHLNITSPIFMNIILWQLFWSPNQLSQVRSIHQYSTSLWT